jgi:hypothetical protein
MTNKTAGNRDSFAPGPRTRGCAESALRRYVCAPTRFDCGHVGCGDSSKNRHPIVRSLEPGDDCAGPPKGPANYQAVSLRLSPEALTWAKEGGRAPGDRLPDRDQRDAAESQRLKLFESGRPGSNRRRPAWEAGILPLNYARVRIAIAESFQRDKPASAFRRRRRSASFGMLPSPVCRASPSSEA